MIKISIVNVFLGPAEAVPSSNNTTEAAANISEM